MVVMFFITNFRTYAIRHKLPLTGTLVCLVAVIFITVILASIGASNRSTFSSSGWHDDIRAGSAVAPDPTPLPAPGHTHAYHKAAPSLAPGASTALNAVDQALADLVDANIAFNVPDHAAINKALVIEAKLSTKLDQDQLKKLIDEAGASEGASLKIADRMAATLSGGSAFDISPSGPQEQWISKSDTTGWTWEVTPKSAGAQILILSFDAILTIDGKDDRRTINTFKKTISVDVSKTETIEDWLETIKKYGEDLSWIWVTILIPIGGGIWAWLRRRRQPEHS